MKNCSYDKINSIYTKNNRLIYSISRLMTKEEIEEIVNKCEIDFFSIDTAMFENVKIYYSIIDLIKEACQKSSKTVGIIAELSGRKIKVQNIYIDGDATNDLIDLKKGEIIKLKWSGLMSKKIKKWNGKKTIFVNFRGLDELVNIEDEIIINDNQGCFVVIEKKEKEVKLLEKTRIRSSQEDLKNIKSEKIKFENQITTFDEELKLDYDNYASLKKSKNHANSYDNKSNFNKFENMFDYDEKLKSQYKNENQNAFIRKSSIRFSRDSIEQMGNFSNEMSNPNEKLLKRPDKLKNTSRSSIIKELICEVKYDCKLSKNAFLFVPNADYKSLGIDLLSCREVNEINHLEKKGVHFICITIRDIEDINSIKEILSEDSQIKILASIPDFTTLQHIDEILDNTSGLVLSRTFGINCDKNFDITRLTKALINKCKEFSKPIFNFIQVNTDFERKKKTIVNDVMEKINDGMDGFFVGINRNIISNSYQFEFLIETLNYFVSLFKRIREDRNKASLSMGDKISNDLPKDHIFNLLSRYDQIFENCCYAYIGDQFKDVQLISRINMNSPCFVFSKDLNFLSNCHLYYSIFPIFLNEINERKIKDLINNQLKLKGTPIIIIKNIMNIKHRSVKLLI